VDLDPNNKPDKSDYDVKFEGGKVKVYLEGTPRDKNTGKYKEGTEVAVGEPGRDVRLPDGTVVRYTKDETGEEYNVRDKWEGRTSRRPSGDHDWKDVSNTPYEGTDIARYPVRTAQADIDPNNPKKYLNRNDAGRYDAYLETDPHTGKRELHVYLEGIRTSPEVVVKDGTRVMLNDGTVVDFDTGREGRELMFVDNEGTKRWSLNKDGVGDLWQPEGVRQQILRARER
jgi:hypothetical protein